MKKLAIILLIFVIIGTFWVWLELNDYFNTNYAKLTEVEKQYFSWQPTDTENKLKQRFSESFGKKEYIFPGTEVKEIKIYKNIPILGTLSSKTLKVDKINYFLTFWNNPKNFHWGETTWTTSESEFYIKFFDENGIAIGKIFLCFNDCGMTFSKPFNPNTKFGGLSDSGKKHLKDIINNPIFWE